MGTRGLFLTHWSLEFNPMMEISYTLMPIIFPFIPLFCFDEAIFKAIEDKLGRFIYSDLERRNNFSCSRICFEMDS